MKSLLLFFCLSILTSFSGQIHKPRKALKDFVYFSNEETDGNPFYIQKYEVSNLEYRLFLNHIMKLDESNSFNHYPNPVKKNHCYGEPMIFHYFTHPAFDYFPIVGISHSQAIAYCKWKTERYHKVSKGKFKKVIFDLPTKIQWNIAANSGIKKQTFPWEGTTMKTKKGAWKGNYNWYFPEVKCDFTCPVDGGIKSKKGIFNLAGNAEEFVKEYGVSKGGSWNDPIDCLKNDSEEKYTEETEQSSERGFRIIMIVEEK